MPNQTNSKRISISLNPELYAIVSDLSELQNKPMSRVVVELMEEMQPIPLQAWLLQWLRLRNPMILPLY